MPGVGKLFQGDVRVPMNAEASSATAFGAVMADNSQPIIRTVTAPWMHDLAVTSRTWVTYHKEKRRSVPGVLVIYRLTEI